MISPEEILAKAGNRYRDVLKTWLNEGTTASLFPMPIRFRHIRAGDDSAEAAAAVQALRAASKAETGRGYSLEWKTIRSSTHGRNEFPERITFDTREDYLNAIAKRADFENYTATVRRIRGAFPQLEPWLQREIARTQKIAREELTDGLITVCRYLADHPRCGLFARELPVSVDTKFVERHTKDFLRPWLDLILSPSDIRADEDHFARRFGLGYSEPLIRIRFLDSRFREELGLPWDDFALPLSKASSEMCFPDHKLTVFIVENLVNALTLPDFPRGVVIGGLGNGANLFRHLDWLTRAKPIFYWGDIDSQGFDILARMRLWFPDIQSLMMDRETLETSSDFRVAGVPQTREPLANLTPEETTLASLCRTQNLRLEQEKISHEWVKAKLTEHHET